MRNLFSEFSSLWPEASRQSLMPLLSKINFIYYPEEKNQILQTSDPSQTMIILNHGTTHDIMQLLSQGYGHCIQKNRPDFSQELLASALMMLKPDAFKKNPLPFFLTGFSPATIISTETNMSIPFRRSSDKTYIIERLNAFIAQNKKLSGIADLCIQIADELIMNALYSAPVDSKGNFLYQNIDRSCEVALKEQDQATFFSCFSDYRIILGCIDQFGSFKKDLFFPHIINCFEYEKSETRSGKFGGAGLGLRYVIENAANFYLHCDANKKSIVAAGLLLQGMRANLSSEKHFHINLC